MQTETIRLSGYWRNSLVDSESSKGALNQNEVTKFTELSSDELTRGRVRSEIVKNFFKGEPEKTEFVEIVLRPRVYICKVEHTQQLQNGYPPVVTPIFVQARLARDGRIYPLPKTHIPRDILEPIEVGSFSVGQLDDQDTFLTKNTIPAIDPADAGDASCDDAAFDRDWKGFVDGFTNLLDSVASDWTPPEDGYTLADYGYIVKEETISASQHIRKLYDHIRTQKPTAPLFDRYATIKRSNPEPCLPDHATFSARLAHASDKFPLAPAQRDALAHLMVAENGEILAVNGPPGTGKTTMLLSVVASMWAKAALDGAEPPVILAASTNNQAVTNIIDAFGKDFATGEAPLGGRWLPDVKSFGAYFPSSAREADAAQKYQTRSFFDSVETEEYFAKAKSAYLDSAVAAFPDINKAEGCTPDIVTRLQNEIRNEVAKLDAIADSWSKLDAARQAVRSELGNDPNAEITRRRRQHDAAASDKHAVDTLKGKWQRFLADEPMLYSLLSWLPPIAKKRFHRTCAFIDPIWPRQHAKGDWSNLDQIEHRIREIAGVADESLHQTAKHVERGEAALQSETSCLSGWQAALKPLGVSDQAHSLSISDCDPLADTQIRFKIFLLTTHYWEGRWLIDMERLLPDMEKERSGKGRATMIARWWRRMKLTPCIVSTFFMLPAEMLVRKRENDDFVDDYLYDFADLLIVDEAGQVLPEVAGASFALSKKALVIGDTKQIEPIWSVPSRVDIANLIDSGLLPDTRYDQAYEELCEMGKTATSGSVMRIAQQLSRYQYDPDLARGMFLYEHRRCFDEIVNYCNELSYKNKLIPKRGTRSGTDNPENGLPAMGYLNIEGVCATKSGSRQNLIEAQAIADWLSQNREKLESAYGLKISQIVGIVSPFGAQVKAISNACREAGIMVGKGEDQMTVGTVHSLQGAERPVVIFSPTYTKENDGGFIDRSPSMLNVAVSRAKDSFLVFGDMNTLKSAKSGTPRKLLWSYLSRHPHNALGPIYPPGQAA